LEGGEELITEDELELGDAIFGVFDGGNEQGAEAEEGPIAGSVFFIVAIVCFAGRIHGLRGVESVVEELDRGVILTLASNRHRHRHRHRHFLVVLVLVVLVVLVVFGLFKI
jgi:hypothetical protein